MTGSRNDFQAPFPNNKLRPGRLFTVGGMRADSAEEGAEEGAEAEHKPGAGITEEEKRQTVDNIQMEAGTIQYG